MYQADNVVLSKHLNSPENEISHGICILDITQSSLGLLDASTVAMRVPFPSMRNTNAHFHSQSALIYTIINKGYPLALGSSSRSSNSRASRSSRPLPKWARVAQRPTICNRTATSYIGLRKNLWNSRTWCANIPIIARSSISCVNVRCATEGFSLLVFENIRNRLVIDLRSVAEYDRSWWILENVLYWHRGNP